MYSFRRMVGAASSNAQAAWLYATAWGNRRLHPHTRLVGITGSAGKTTTKALCNAMLSQFGQCNSNMTSGNKRLPVARFVRAIRSCHRYAALEISGHKPGYLDLQMKIARPNVGVLTMVGRDHYSAFKSVEEIAREKSKIVTQLPADGIAVLNADDPLVREIGEATDRRVIWVGSSEGATVRLLDARSIWPEPLTLTVVVAGTTYTVRTRLHGEHLALSVLATLGVALALDLPLDRAIEAMAGVEPELGRMQIVEGADGVVFVRDDWKAPHWSLHAPVQFMRNAVARRKIAIIGTISDMSGRDDVKYKRIVREVRDVFDLLVFVGPNAHYALRARCSENDESLQGFASSRTAAGFLRTALRAGDLVLVKGSHVADHLGRLVIDRASPIACWKERCSFERFCDRCPRLFDPKSIEPTDLIGSEGPSASRNWNGDGAGAVRVVAGLGNPGESYRDTPHNAGYAVLDQLSELVGGVWEAHSDGAACFIEIDGERIALFKPDSMMNASGARILGFMMRVGGHPAKLTVVHDEMDLDLGNVRVKRGGGDAGHKGVRSAASALGTPDFTRVRVGVRKCADDRRARDVVLETYSPEDLVRLNEGFEKAVGLMCKELGLPTHAPSC